MEGIDVLRATSKDKWAGDCVGGGGGSGNEMFCWGWRGRLTLCAQARSEGWGLGTCIMTPLEREVCDGEGLAHSWCFLARVRGGVGILLPGEKGMLVSFYALAGARAYVDCDELVLTLRSCLETQRLNCLRCGYRWSLGRFSDDVYVSVFFAMTRETMNDVLLIELLFVAMSDVIEDIWLLVAVIFCLLIWLIV